SQSAGNTARHGFDPETGLREQGRAHFADAVVASASEIWSQNGFDRLVISAAPRMLGALRDRLDGPMAKALSADMDKDLLKIPVGDLPAHFADVAAF
uniref:host attachment protein n=1 Tax=Actibacterium sp. TaxID=1872125 RepID=UPI0035630D8E